MQREDRPQIGVAPIRGHPVEVGPVRDQASPGVFPIVIPPAKVMQDGKSGAVALQGEDNTIVGIPAVNGHPVKRGAVGDQVAERILAVVASAGETVQHSEFGLGGGRPGLQKYDCQRHYKRRYLLHSDTPFGELFTNFLFRNFNNLATKTQRH